MPEGVFQKDITSCLSKFQCTELSLMQSCKVFTSYSLQSNALIRLKLTIIIMMMIIVIIIIFIKVIDD